MVDANPIRGLRPQVREQLIKLGIPSLDVDQIVDLAFFAAQSAFEEIGRITARAASQPAAKTAFEIALQLTAAITADAANAIQERGQAEGRHFHAFEVKGSFNG